MRVAPNAAGRRRASASVDPKAELHAMPELSLLLAATGCPLMWVVWLRGKKRAAMVEWQPLADHSYEDLQVRLFI